MGGYSYYHGVLLPTLKIKRRALPPPPTPAPLNGKAQLRLQGPQSLCPRRRGTSRMQPHSLLLPLGFLSVCLSPPTRMSATQRAGGGGMFYSLVFPSFARGWGRKSHPGRRTEPSPPKRLVAGAWRKSKRPAYRMGMKEVG